MRVLGKLPAVLEGAAAFLSPPLALMDTRAALSLVKTAPQAGERVKQVPLKSFQGKPRGGWEWAQVPFSTQGFERKGN